MTASTTLALALGLAAIFGWLVVLRAAWRAWQPPRLLRLGRYADARHAAEQIERSWMRSFPSVRVSCAYVIGCARHLEGDLEGALAALAPLEHARLRRDIRHAVCTLEAACLLLSDREFARADALLTEAGRIQRAPEDLLLGALAKRGLGQPDRAAELFEEANANVTAKATGSTSDDAIFPTLRGLYLTKVDRWAEAQRDFETALKAPTPSVYVTLARRMLEPSEPAVDSGPSSLAPQVVAKDDAER